MDSLTKIQTVHECCEKSVNGGCILEYESFKELVVEKFNDFLPEMYEIVINPVDRINCTLDGLSIIRVNESKTYISPTIYINHMYEDYVATENLNVTLERAAESLMNTMAQNESINVSELTDADYVKDKIVFQLINTEQNRKMLANMPHREFKDLSVIYRMVVKIDKEGVASALIHNGLADTLGFTEEQLFKLAAENTKRMFPPVIKSMNEVLGDMFYRDGIPMDMAELMIAEILPQQQMYVISNKRGINGAVSMLYEDVLHELAEKLDSDLYIIPSSIHEVVAVSSNFLDPDEIAEMVEAVNIIEVPLEERLSNQVYYYDRTLSKISMATNTGKRLD